MTDTPPAVRVAEATAADASAFAEFFREAWRQAGPGALGFTGASDAVVAELTAPEAFRSRIGGPERHMYLAWAQEDVVGFAATTHLDDTCVELAGIIVLESQAGRGIGGALVTAAIDSAASAGYGEMVVRTETANVRAIGFYEAHGFVRSGTETEDVAGEAVELAVLLRRLA